MRIAQIAPLHESVPPNLYGGTERVVSYLTEELVRKGHQVTLFASADSKTTARLVPVCERALRLDSRCRDPLPFHFILMEEVIRRQHEFDIIHSHIDTLGFILGRRLNLPVITTMHGRLDLWEHPFIHREYREFPLVSISNAQRRPLPQANWLTTIYHGLPEDLYTCREQRGDYLVYIGRISPEKGVDSAVRIAVESGIPLKVAAKVGQDDREYFDTVIRPLFALPLVEYLGEVDDREKGKLLREAMAFLHPVDWPEPFGLAMLEAMACGTPVIARGRGSIPEVVDHGLTGFIFDRDEEAVSLLGQPLSVFSRRRCRQHFENRFLAGQMADAYLTAYRIMLAGWTGELLSGQKGEDQCLKLAG
jgi:glycosyltransferase involved in cell wall biosynthesis